MADEYLHRCNVNYKVAFSQWRSFFRQRYVRHDFLNDIISDCNNEKVQLYQVQQQTYQKTLKSLREFFIKAQNQITLRKLNNDYLPKGFVPEYIHSLEHGGPAHLINTFKQLSWPEPLDKAELNSDRDFMKELA